MCDLKRFLWFTLGFAFILLLVPTLSLATGNNMVTVKAKVPGNCVFTTATSTMDFGSLDVTSGANATTTSTVNIKCTKKANFSIVGDNGLNYDGSSKRMKSATDPLEFIKYSLGISPASGTGSGMGTAIPITLTGTIVYADYQNAIADDFQDTVVVTVTP